MCLLAEYYTYNPEERSDEEVEGTFSEDEAVTQRGLRRSQSVKLSRSKVRKEVCPKSSTTVLQIVSTDYTRLKNDCKVTCV